MAWPIEKILKGSSLVRPSGGLCVRDDHSVGIRHLTRRYPAPIQATLTRRRMRCTRPSWWAVIRRRRRSWRPCWAIWPAWFGLSALGIAQVFLGWPRRRRGRPQGAILPQQVGLAFLPPLAETEVLTPVSLLSFGSIPAAPLSGAVGVYRLWVRQIPSNRCRGWPALLTCHIKRRGSTPLAAPRALPQLRLGAEGWVG